MATIETLDPQEIEKRELIKRTVCRLFIIERLLDLPRSESQNPLVVESELKDNGPEFAETLQKFREEKEALQAAGASDSEMEKMSNLRRFLDDRIRELEQEKNRLRIELRSIDQDALVHLSELHNLQDKIAMEISKQGEVPRELIRERDAFVEQMGISPQEFRDMHLASLGGRDDRSVRINSKGRPEHSR